MTFGWALLLLCACSGPADEVLAPMEVQNDVPSGEVVADLPAQGCDTSDQVKKFLIQSDANLLLKGGEADSQHFDITHWDLNPCGLRFGFCREHFPAVYAPRYQRKTQADAIYDAEDRFILVEDKQVKAYSIDLLVKHEAVNDTINGHPILVAYCTLADLPIVYTRNYCGHTLTFALSGYTYSEKQIWHGTEAFVMWDRETESLWWPLGEEAVSGTFVGEPLQEFQSHKWTVTTWGEITSKHKEVKVLANDIVVETPRGWPRIAPASVSCR